MALFNHGRAGNSIAYAVIECKPGDAERAMTEHRIDAVFVQRVTGRQGLFVLRAGHRLAL